ncbi:MAG: glycerol-3-phosphate dehydrogenase/oxidase [Candidatus Dormibacteria bacterium]
MIRSASLNAQRRTAELDRLGNGGNVDVLVVGGGIVGVGVALDAASRGLSVALVERRDLANGTSRWSSKLIHGGLRYLRQAEIGLAWESARERHILMQRTAPHLVQALPFVVPLDAAVSPILGLLSDVGIRAGDALRRFAGSSRRELPGPRRISAHEAARLVPGLRRDDLRGAILMWDGQAVDDARLVIAVARTAAQHGAAILTYVSVEKLEPGRATLHDEISGRSLEIRAAHIINATGVWAGRFDDGLSLRPSKGVHLVVGAQALGDPRAALMVPVPRSSARWVGATPVGDDRLLVGVTDDHYDGEIPDEATVLDSERDFLLGVLNAALRRPLLPQDVIGGFAGFRPLISDAAASRSTADLSRHHVIHENHSTGVTSVVGGKFTTYRQMAEEVVDRLTQTPCRTKEVPVIGAADAASLDRLRTALPGRLVDRYGAEASVLVALAADDRSLLEPIAPGLRALGVELLFGLRHEGALNADDLLERRLRLGLVAADRAAAESAAAHLLHAEGRAA